MYVDKAVISAAAELIHAGLGELPVADHAEWKGYSRSDTAVFKLLMEEITWADLTVAVQSAAMRLKAEPEPAVDDQAEQDDADDPEYEDEEDGDTGRFIDETTIES
jgi:hypothetical protein